MSLIDYSIGIALGPDGKPRQLHLDRGLEAVDFSLGPIFPQSPQATEKPAAVRLVQCDKFVIDRWQIASPATFGGDDRFHILQPLAGEIRIEGDPESKPLKLGDTCLLPAGLGQVRIIPEKESSFLDIYLPDRKCGGRLDFNKIRLARNHRRRIFVRRSIRGVRRTVLHLRK